jgi:hypothetical protein
MSIQKVIKNLKSKIDERFSVVQEMKRTYEYKFVIKQVAEEIISGKRKVNQYEGE